MPTSRSTRTALATCTGQASIEPGRSRFRGAAPAVYSRRVSSTWPVAGRVFLSSPVVSLFAKVERIYILSMNKKPTVENGVHTTTAADVLFSHASHARRAGRAGAVARARPWPSPLFASYSVSSYVYYLCAQFRTVSAKLASERLPYLYP